MAKQSTGERPGFVLDEQASAPLYRQLYERLRAEILSGQLRAGARLPSTRQLASDLGVSRNTTAQAYELLLLEGYVDSRVGHGTRVAHMQSAGGAVGAGQSATRGRNKPAHEQPAVLGERGAALARMAGSGEFRAEHPAAHGSLFRVGQPDTSAFPYELWARLAARHARASLAGVAGYGSGQGYAPLRAAIAAHIGITRGVHCSPDTIMITSGSQGALDLVARVLLDPGDRVWVEDPGYLGARGALVAAGARLTAVPVDHEGLDVAAGERLGTARLAVVTPSHQFPTAVTMSLGRRMELLEWSRRASAWVVEDDYDSEYRYSGRPLEALQGLDRSGRVIYIGTFSKVLFPALRLGYLVAPPEVIAGCMAARRFVDSYPPQLEQLALTDFIAEGHFARHLRKMRQVYLERRDALVAALRRDLGDVLTVTVPEAGLHLVAWLPAQLEAEPIVARVAAQGVYIQTVAQCCIQPRPRDGLLLGFALGTVDELRAGVGVLAQAVRQSLRIG